MLIYSWRLDHVLRHWEFGIIHSIFTIPLVFLYFWAQKDYYLSNIIVSFFTGFAALIMDFDGFKEWLWKRT